MSAPGFEKIPAGYEYSYLPHDFGGPWSQPLSCTRCGAIVLGKNVNLHDTGHDAPRSARTAPRSWWRRLFHFDGYPATTD